MSYVPATFTAGFALMLTAAGAIGGQWVSGIQQTVNERSSVKTEARARTPVAPAAPARNIAAAPEIPNPPVSIEILELQHLQALGVPVAPMLEAPVDELPLKTTPAAETGKSRPAPKKKK